jgi:hypothetical protein
MKVFFKNTAFFSKKQYELNINRNDEAVLESWCHGRR